MNVRNLTLQEISELSRRTTLLVEFILFSSGNGGKLSPEEFRNSKPTEVFVLNQDSVENVEKASTSSVLRYPELEHPI